MMRKILMLGLAAGLFLFSGGWYANAGELKVNGFADIILTLSDDWAEDAALDSEASLANATERKFTATAEVDFEYTEGPVKFRLDLDLPGPSTSRTTMVDVSDAQDGSAMVPVTDTDSHGIAIEQANFRWSLPGLETANLALTGGVFNAPIGFELQDAPDMLQTTNGQLFNLVPSNLAGVMLSGGMDMVSLDLYFVNEWRQLTEGVTGGTLGEENSFGALLTVAPIEQVTLAAGYITAPEVDQTDAAVTAAGISSSDEDVIDIVLTGAMALTPEIEGLLALEYLTDENNDAYAVVLNVQHNTPSFPHGLTLRYDSVDCSDTSAYCGTGIDHEPTSITVAANVGLAENLGVVLEWNSFDPDLDDIPATAVDEGDTFDQILLEFVATF